MAFKIQLLSDVAGFLKGTKSVEDELDKVADSLDQLADDTAKNADEAGDKLAHEFSDAFDKVTADAKDAGRKVGDGLDDGTRRAADGMDDMKDEAKQSARETAASFSDVSDALDLVQEIAANAFVGFGPAGLAAGALAAIGIGILKTSLDAAKEKADDAKEKALSLADAIAEVGGDPRAINWAEQLRDTMQEIVDTKEWFEFWQNAPIDRLTDWTAKVKAYGVTQSDVMKAATGDTEALARVNAVLDKSIQDLNRAQAESMDMNGNVDTSYTPLIENAQKFKDDVNAQAQAVADATGWQKAYADATKDVSAAQTEAQKASEDWSNALTDHLSVADEGLDQFVKDGKLNLKKWAEELAARKKDNALIEDFSIDVAPKLSDAALANFEKLPAETQAQIAKAYGNGKGKKADRVIANLEAEAKVTKVTVDTSETKTTPVTLPVEVDIPAAAKHTTEAAKAAQETADKSENVIEFTTKIDRDELQRQVNRAAASITPPTVYVKTKTQKEVP